MNYVITLKDGRVEIRGRAASASTLSQEISGVKSVELLRRSIWPPAFIGTCLLTLGLALRLTDNTWLGFVPTSFVRPSEYAAVGGAAVCLVILLTRLFFANLVLKPMRGSPVIVRFVPVGSAKRFVAMLQSQVSIP